jgi:predicted RNA polymerase sigma factor
VPEATPAQRISRAKQRIKDAGATFEPPTPHDFEGRIRAVLHLLYLSSTKDMQRPPVKPCNAPTWQNANTCSDRHGSPPSNHGKVRMKGLVSRG